MHEGITYDTLLDRMLATARASDRNLDTREGFFSGMAAPRRR